MEDKKRQLKVDISTTAKVLFDDYASLIMHDIEDEVIADVECASDYPITYNDSDIKLAIGRVLSDKLITLMEIKSFCYDLLDNHKADTVENNLARNILEFFE